MLDNQGRSQISCDLEDEHPVKGPITIVMVDDHAGLRSGLRKLLDMEHDLRVIADVGDRAEAIAVVVTQKPAIMLLDIELSDGDLCFPIMDELAERRQETRVILYSGQLNDAYLELARLKPNCKGILDKVIDSNEVIAAIRSVASGSEYYNSKVKSRLDRPSLLESLTPRERVVLALIASDFSAKMVSVNLNISTSTAGAHVEKIKKKLGLHTNIALTNFAHQIGLLKIT